MTAPPGTLIGPQNDPCKAGLDKKFTDYANSLPSVYEVQTRQVFSNSINNYDRLPPQEYAKYRMFIVDRDTT